MATKKSKQSLKRPKLAERVRSRVTGLQARRAHHSFRLTKRRDTPKRLPLPGLFKFTSSVFKTLFMHKRLFFSLLLIYVVVTAATIGISQQDQYRTLSDAVQTIGPDLAGGNIDAITQTAGLFGITVAGGLNAALTETQQFYLAILAFITWMVVVWLLRQVLAGNTVKVRDALYNACAPFVSTLLVLALMALQSLPAVIGIMSFSIVTQNAGMSGLEAMLFGMGALLLIVLSLYWLCSSVFALLIVTLPGTYPWAAVRAAGDIAVGRRVSLIIRLLWLALVLLVVWLVIFVPALLIDIWIHVSWSPLVALTLQLLSGFSLLFAATYIYMLYRRMIDEPKAV